MSFILELDKFILKSIFEKVLIRLARKRLKHKYFEWLALTDTEIYL